eukprot:gb/GECG01011406.1/.p1 GENE.gb/GECG01011406.1/~~gb/GECG01011406.1/.p1  ORF type:complete len:530 (+),score=45.72 gb/GECG01011406.1/:1-1590(+)
MELQAPYDKADGLLSEAPLVVERNSEDQSSPEETNNRDDIGDTKNRNISENICLGLIVLYVFLKEFKPSEPYLTDYLVYDRGFSQEDTYQKIYPVWTYSALAVAAVVALTVDQLPHYKYLVVLEGLAYLLTRVLIIFGRSVVSQQIMQFTYAVATSTEVGYTSYVYLTLSRRRFHFATGCIRAAQLLGTFSSAGLAQVFIAVAYEGDHKKVPYMTLNWISFASVSLAVIVALMLPKFADSEVWSPFLQRVLDGFRRCACCSRATGDKGYIEVDNEEGDEDEFYSSAVELTRDGSQTAEAESQLLRSDTAKPLSFMKNIKQKARLALLSLKEFLRKPVHQEMAVIYSFSLASLYQAQNYSQNFWDSVNGGSSTWNGGVTALATLFAAGASYAITNFRSGLLLGRKDVTILFTACAGLTLLLPALLHFTGAIWFAYGAWVLFRTFVSAIISISQFRIARGASHRDKRYGTLYGVFSFLGLLVASVLQFIVGKQGLHLDVRIQFIVYAIFLWAFVGALPILLMFRCCKASVD